MQITLWLKKGKGEYLSQTYLHLSEYKELKIGSAISNSQHLSFTPNTHTILQAPAIHIRSTEPPLHCLYKMTVREPMFQHNIPVK